MARSKLSIVPATLRDVSYVMANLNPADEAEVMCQVPPGAKRHELAYGLLMSGDNFAVRDGNQPVAVYGTVPISVCYLNVWALGTKAMWRAVPMITDHLVFEHLPERIAQGYIGMEARSHVDHPTAHKWMEQVGAKRDGEPYAFGLNRELFLTFRWSEADLSSIKRKRRRAS